MTRDDLTGLFASLVAILSLALLVNGIAAGMAARSTGEIVFTGDTK